MIWIVTAKAKTKTTKNKKDKKFLVRYWALLEPLPYAKDMVAKGKSELRAG